MMSARGSAAAQAPRTRYACRFEMINDSTKHRIKLATFSCHVLTNALQTVYRQVMDCKGALAGRIRQAGLQQVGQHLSRMGHHVFRPCVLPCVRQLCR